MEVYAVVGGIAAGKSTVVRRLARRHGGVRIDADRLGHQVLRRAGVRRRLLEVFGPDIVGPGGQVDRKRLGALVFGHRRRLAALEAIVHPEIARLLEARLRALARRGARLVLLDAALFLEFDLARPVDGVLAVVAPLRVRRERLRRRTGLAAADLEARLRSQPRIAIWTRQADVVLDTDCALAELDARIDSAWRALRRRRGRPGRSSGRGANRRTRRAAGTRLSPQGVPLMSRSSLPKSKRSTRSRRLRTSGTTRKRPAKSSAP